MTPKLMTEKEREAIEERLTRAAKHRYLDWTGMSDIISGGKALLSHIAALENMVQDAKVAFKRIDEDITFIDSAKNIARVALSRLNPQPEASKKGE